MITLSTLKQIITQLDEAALARWIEADLVCAEGEAGAWVFQDIDIARIRLIIELRTLEIEEPTLPVVLSLMDQLYDLRRRMRRLQTALAAAPEDVRAALLLALDGTG